VIVVDSSALIAILEEEPEHRQFKAAIESARRRIVSSVSIYETSIVLLRRRGPEGLADVSELIDAFDFEVVPFDRSSSEAALAAYARFGKGIDPKARLNMGDCASYALAMTIRAPLLFKGDDFVHTDIVPCL
jgi:ribonuclease VapC